VILAQAELWPHLGLEMSHAGHPARAGPCPHTPRFTTP
jgi:hypothetical protein